MVTVSVLDGWIGMDGWEWVWWIGKYSGWMGGKVLRG